jgi:hypothetical protein
VASAIIAGTESVTAATAPDEDLIERRRDLCRSLRRHREHADLTQNNAAAALEWSRSKFVRIARSTWLVSGAARTRMPFGELMGLVDGVTGVNGCPVAPGELGDRWEEAPGRVAGAIEAVRVLRASCVRRPCSAMSGHG